MKYSIKTNNMAPEILAEILPQMESKYILRSSTVRQSRYIETVIYGSETIPNLRPKICDILPTELKKVMSLTLFKKRNCE